MKKVLAIILCMVLVFSLAACGNNNTAKVEEPKEEKQTTMEDLKEKFVDAPEYNEKEIISIAKAYIEDKYGFEPKVLNTKNMTVTEVIKKTTLRSAEDVRTKLIPSKDILVEMEYDGKRFTTVVANEFGDGECFDSYQQDEIEDALIGYFDNNIDYEADIMVSYGYMHFEPTLERECMVHEKFENPDSLFEVLKENGRYTSTNVLVKLNEEENVVYDLATLNLTKFTEELTMSNGQYRIINFRDRADFDKISYKDVFYDNFSEVVMLGLYAKESVWAYNETPEYEDYTLVDTGDFLISYAGNGETEILNDFSLNDIENYTNAPDNYEDIELVSNAVYLHLNHTHPNEFRRITMYAKLPKPEKLVLENGDDSLYKYNYMFSSTTDSISFGGNEPDLIGDYYVYTMLHDTPDHIFFITKKNNEK